MARGTIWFGVGGRLRAGLASLSLLTVAAGAVAFAFYGEFQAAIDDVSQHALPALSAASQLAQQSQTIIANAPAIVVADSQFTRRTVALRIEDQAAGIGEQISRLRALQVDPAMVEQLAQLRERLIANLRELDAGVERRIERERRLQQLYQQLRLRQDQIRDSLSHGLSDTELDSAHEIFDRGRDLLISQFATFAAANHLVVERLRSETARDAARLTESFNQLAPDLKDKIRPLYDDLIHLGGGPDGVFDTQRERFEAIRSVQSALSANRVISDQLIAGVARVLGRVEYDVLGTSRRFATRTAEVRNRLLIIVGVCVVMGGLITVYLNRSVLRRLTQVRTAMMAYLRGEPARIPTEGHDEISEIGRTLDFLVHSISEREVALRDSEDRLARQNLALRQIGALQSAGDPGTSSSWTWSLLVSEAQAALRCARFSIWLELPDRPGTLACAMEKDGEQPPALAPGTTLPLNDAPAYQYALRDDQQMVVDWIEQDDRCLGIRTYIQQFGVTALLHVAVVKEGRLAGMVAAEARGGMRLWTADERSFVESMAHFVETSLIELDRLRNAQRLEASEKRMRQLLEASPVGITIVDTAFRRRLFTNRRALNLGGPRGADDAPFSGRHCFVEDNDFEWMMERLRRAGAITGWEVRQRTATGDTAWVLADLGRFQYQDQQAIIAWHYDITERKQAGIILNAAKEEAERALAELKATQQSLIQAEKMASLGQLVAGVAHEVNTPVGVALSAASQMEEEVRAISAQVAENKMTRKGFEEFLAITGQLARLALTNGQRAADLIQSFKHVAVDQTSGERRRFELGGYLAEVLLSLGPSLRRLPYKVELDCPMAIQLESYPGAISQIVTNLVMNAMTHAFTDRSSGTVTLHATLIDEDVHLVVTDDGRGIPEAARGRIFDPFFTTRRGSGGSGLGLHIVYNLTTATLGGTITVESEPTGGTCFRLRFPQNAPKNPAQRNEAA